MNINMNKELKKLHPTAKQQIREAILLATNMADLIETSILVKENSKQTLIKVNTQLLIKILTNQ